MQRGKSVILDVDKYKMKIMLIYIKAIITTEEVSFRDSFDDNAILIVARILITRNIDTNKTILTNIVLKWNVNMLDIVSKQMLGQFGFLAKIPSSSIALGRFRGRKTSRHFSGGHHIALAWFGGLYDCEIDRSRLSKYGDTKTAHSIMLIEPKKPLEANPLFHDKLAFPKVKLELAKSAMQEYKAKPRYQDLFTDHTCSTPNRPLAPTLVNLPVAAVAKPVAYTSLGAHIPFPPTTAATNAGALANWMVNVSASSSAQAAVVTALSVPVPQNQVLVLKCPRTLPAA